MKIDLEYIMNNAEAVVVDDDFVCFPSEDEGELVLSKDGEDNIHFDEESFENASGVEDGSILIRSTSGEKYTLRFLRNMF